MAGIYYLNTEERPSGGFDSRGYEQCWTAVEKLGPASLPPHVQPNGHLDIVLRMQSMGHNGPLCRSATFPTHLNTSVQWVQHSASPILRSSPITLPISPPASVVPQLSPTLEASTRQTSPSTSETSSRRESWFINNMDRGVDGSVPVLAVNAQYPQLITSAQYPFDHHYPVHDPYSMPMINHSVALHQINPVHDNMLQQSTPAFDFEPSQPLSSTYGCQGQVVQSSAEASEGSIIDAEGDVDEDDTMEIDPEDNEDTLSESSTKDAEGEDADDSDYHPSKDQSKKKQSPVRARRRSGHSSTNSQSSHAGDTPGPIRTKKNRSKNKKRATAMVGRAFPCPLRAFGCTETFDAKNEWKRHINTQHVAYHTYRCELCIPSRRIQKPYRQMQFDFKRKDLFTMHMKRMHHTHYGIEPPQPNTGRKGFKHKDPEKTLNVCNEVAARCLIEIRAPPDEAGCILCEAQFSGPECWEARTDHIANEHFEKLRRDGLPVPQTDDWEHDELLQEWLEEEGIIQKEMGHWKLTT